MTRQQKKDIRKVLAGIVTNEHEAWWCNPHLFREKIEPIFPKEVEIIALPPKDAERQFNCFIYAFGLENDLKVLKSTRGFIYSPFVEKLIAAREFTEIKKPVPRDLVFYRNPKKFGGTITHAGLYTSDGRILSKWSWGPVLKHKLLDVPDFYGNKISYYKPFSKRAMIKLYKKYQS